MTTSSIIYWNKTEVANMVKAAAEIIIAGNASMRGCDYSWVDLVNKAQIQAIPQERHRKYDNLKVCSKKSYSEAIRSEVSRLILEKKPSLAPAKVAEEVKVIETPEAVEVKAEKIFLEKAIPKKVDTLPELGLDMFVDSLAEQFKTKLRRALNTAAADVLEEMSAVSGPSSLGMELSVSPPRGPVEVSAPNHKFAHKIKVGVIGMIEGHDKTFIEKGLGDIFNFKYVDSPSKVSSLGSCEVALVRVKFVNHGLIEACKSANRDLKFVDVKGSASSVNDWLTNYYLTQQTS